jgi:hypothetical protein
MCPDYKQSSPCFLDHVDHRPVVDYSICSCLQGLIEAICIALPALFTLNLLLHPDLQRRSSVYPYDDEEEYGGDNVDGGWDENQQG